MAPLKAARWSKSLFCSLFQNLNYRQCFDCQSGLGCPVNQSISQCYLTSQQCNTPQECSAAGECSDVKYLVDNGANPRYGGCIVDRTLPYSTSTFGLYLLLPFCNAGDQIAFPNGCIDPQYNRSTCEAMGYQWREPGILLHQPILNRTAITETACLADKGCYQIWNELSATGTQYAFSPKDEVNCTVAQGTWKPYFEWTKAHWITGTLRTLTWRQRNISPSYQYTTRLDFRAVEQAFLEGAAVQVNVSIILLIHTVST